MAASVGLDSPYPEGGLQAWLVVLGAWFAMFPAMGLLNVLAPLHAWIADNELPGTPPSTIGWILSIYAFLIYVCGAQVGPVFDSRDIRWLILPGSTGIVLSMICLSFSQEFYQFLLSFGILGGMSASCLFNPSISAIGHWFSARRGLATGIACTAGGMGGIVFSLIILYLAPRIGFPWAIRVMALISAVSGISACCLLRKRLSPNKVAGAAIDLKALADGKFALATAALWLVEFAVFIPYTYISSYAIHMGIDPQQAYLLNVLLNVGAIPGRALPGLASDRLGTYNVMTATAFFCAVFILGLWLPIPVGNLGAITAFTILFGFFSGAAISLTPVCIGQMCGTENYGKRLGTAFSLAGIGALIGSPLAGLAIQMDGGSYDRLIIVSGAMYAGSAVMFFVTRMVVTGWRLGAKF